MKKARICQLCKKSIAPGTTFYECSTRIVSGFDGTLPPSEQPLETVVQEVLGSTAGKNADELMEDIYQEFVFILCRECRLLFRDRLQAMMSGKGKILPFAKAKEKGD